MKINLKRIQKLKFISYYNKAFSLAEILLALVIIGIIAAITIFNLTANIKKIETQTRLRKAQSTLANMVIRSEIDNGPMKYWEQGESIGDIRENYWEVYFEPYLTYSKLCKDSFDCGYKYNLSSSKWQNASWGIMTSSTRLLFKIADGMVVFYPKNTTNGKGEPVYVTILFIDINGTREPNTYCKDVFPFVRDYDKSSILPTDCTTKYLQKHY